MSCNCVHCTDFDGCPTDYIERLKDQLEELEALNKENGDRYEGVIQELTVVSNCLGILRQAVKIVALNEPSNEMRQLAEEAWDKVEAMLDGLT